MYKFEKIKLIIWDLDETFWKGTLSEGTVTIESRTSDLIKKLTDIGIVNSICSKNDWNKVHDRLREEELWDYFVFSSVNWEAKGTRVKQLIADMQLRPANVLFIDDNVSNREEVKYFCPEIMTEGPEIIDQLISDCKKSNKIDLEHKRLDQYKVLETKKKEQKTYTSNEQFLLDSNIQVEILHDCIGQIDRIHDLIMRSNQLNFTKVRSSLSELQILLEDDSIETGYVKVHDKFGDYGIVGFYALKENKLKHFVFSCRTLGMGIEQYTYNLLKRPILVPVGEVISNLDDTELPKWINHKNNSEVSDKMAIHNLKEHTVLIKGPCDLFQVYPYIANTELFDTEFSHTTDKGIYIESTSHTTHMVEAIRLSQEEKNRVIQEVPFVDMDIYSDCMYKNHYKVVFISILTDANLGVYRRKETGERIAFVEYIQPITDPKNWEGLMNGTLLTNNFHFTEKILKEFADKYEYIGRNTPEVILENLKFIRKYLPEDCTLVIMLGGELYYEKNQAEAYKDRHIVHKEINNMIRPWAATMNNVRLMDVNKYLVDQSSFYDHFNHYVKPVYYALAKEMVDIVNDCTGEEIKETSRVKMIYIHLKEIIAPIFYRIRGKKNSK